MFFLKKIYIRRSFCPECTPKVFFSKYSLYQHFQRRNTFSCSIVCSSIFTVPFSFTLINNPFFLAPAQLNKFACSVCFHLHSLTISPRILSFLEVRVGRAGNLYKPLKFCIVFFLSFLQH